MVMRIKHEIVVRATVRQDKLLTKFVKSLRDEDATIILVDEIYRRVIFSLPLLKYENIVQLISEYTVSANFEVKAVLTHSLSSAQLMSLLSKLKEIFNTVNIVKPEQSYLRIMGLIKVDSGGGLVEIYPSREKRRGRVIIRYMPRIVQVNSTSLTLIPPSAYTMNYTSEDEFKEAVRRAIDVLNTIESKIIKVIKRK